MIWKKTKTINTAYASIVKNTRKKILTVLVNHRPITARYNAAPVLAGVGVMYLNTRLTIYGMIYAHPVRLLVSIGKKLKKLKLNTKTIWP
jgi:hypothetical protein